jgi:addiction module RelB/DinJ family antitoxin
MSKTAVINLKTDPALKKKAAETAEKLGISLSAVLNNELRRFVIEQRVSFQTSEVPNAETARLLAESRKEIEAGDYYGPFDSVEEMLASLHEHIAQDELAK